MSKDKQKKALEAIQAWRLLYYDDLLNDKEKASISKKINTKYGKYLSPLRDKEPVT